MFFSNAVKFSMVLMLASQLSGQTQAAWVVVSDFETASLGDPDGQESWTNSGANASAYSVKVDPSDAGNQALWVSGPPVSANPTTGGDAFLTLPGGGIADGTTSTVFFRMSNTNPGDLVFGSSDVATPSAWGDYEGYKSSQGEIFLFATAAVLIPMPATLLTNGPMFG